MPILTLWESLTTSKPVAEFWLEARVVRGSEYSFYADFYQAETQHSHSFIKGLGWKTIVELVSNESKTIGL